MEGRGVALAGGEGGGVDVAAAEGLGMSPPGIAVAVGPNVKASCLSTRGFQDDTEYHSARPAGRGKRTAWRGEGAARRHPAALFNYFIEIFLPLSCFNSAGKCERQNTMLASS